MTGTSVWAGDTYWSDTWGVIRMWRSQTLAPGSFVGGGVVYNNSRRCQQTPERIWAPEVHYIPQRAQQVPGSGGYFISVDCGSECSGGHILRSTSGTALGPYESLVSGIPGGDVSIFYDPTADDVYAISTTGSGIEATPLTKDMRGLALRVRALLPKQRTDPYPAGAHKLTMEACNASFADAGQLWWLHSFGPRSPRCIELGHDGQTALCVDTSGGKEFKAFSCGAGGTASCDNQQLEFRAVDGSLRWHCNANSFCLTQNGSAGSSPVLAPCDNASVVTQPNERWEWSAPTSSAASAPIANAGSHMCLQMERGLEPAFPHGPPSSTGGFRLDTGGGCQGDCTHTDIGFEGPFMLYLNGSYYLSSSAFGNATVHGGPKSPGFADPTCGNCWYSAYMGRAPALNASFTSTGRGKPDGGWLAVPAGGHNVYFRTKEGELWATIWYGSNPHGDTPSSKQPYIDLPSIVKVEIAEDGRLVSVGAPPFGRGPLATQF